MVGRHDAKRRLRALLAAAAAVCAAGAVSAALYVHRSLQAGTVQPFTPRTVESVVVKNTVQVSGNIEPLLEENLGFLSSGEVSAVYVKEGDQVKAGDLIAELDDSEQVYDLAQLDHDIEKARISGPPGDLKLLLLQRGVKQSALRKRKLYTPISGVVSEVDITKGELTKSENEINAVARVIDTSSMKAEVEIDEMDVPLVRIGQDVRFSFDALPRLDVRGRVRSLPLEARLTEEGIAVLDTELIIEDPPSEILPGYSFSAEIMTGGGEEILLLDERAVFERDGRTMVLVPGQGGAPQTQEVAAADYGGGRVRIVSGLRKGDTVLVAPEADARQADSGVSGVRRSSGLLGLLHVPGLAGGGRHRDVSGSGTHSGQSPGGRE